MISNRHPTRVVVHLLFALSATTAFSFAPLWVHTLRKSPPTTPVLRGKALQTRAFVRMSSNTQEKQAPPAPATVDDLFEEAVSLYQRFGAGMVGEEGLVEAHRLLQEVFVKDFEGVQASFGAVGAKRVQNVTCMRAVQGEESSRFDDELLNTKTEPGRACSNGRCCTACSRVQIQELVTPKECMRMLGYADKLAPEVGSNLYLKLTAAAGDIPAHLFFIRLCERMRRAVAHEYGIRLQHLAPRQTFVSRITEDSDPDEYSVVHVDECSTSAYHYSCVLYLATQGQDFEGGDFIFTDPGKDGERVLTRKGPTMGSAVIFSSGWENVHYVDTVHAGTRVAIPAFYSTEPTFGEPPFERLNEASKAIALYMQGIMPSSLDNFLQFMVHWASFFDTEGK